MGNNLAVNVRDRKSKAWFCLSRKATLLSGRYRHFSIAGAKKEGQLAPSSSDPR
jgi:hypothetical protein